MIIDQTVTTVHLDDLVANPDNPRQILDGIDELAQSIEAQGLLQPLLVVDNAPGFLVVDGNRRLAALAKLDWKGEIAVHVVELDRTGRLLAAIAAGAHGRPLPPLDEARAFQHLVNLGLTQRQIAEKVGCNQSHVSKRLSLIDAPEPVRQALSDGKIKVREAERAARGKPEPAPKKTEPAPPRVEAEMISMSVAEWEAFQRDLDDARTRWEQAVEAVRDLDGEITTLNDIIAQLRRELVDANAVIAAMEAGERVVDVPLPDAADDLFPSREPQWDDAQPLPSVQPADAIQQAWEAAHPDCTSRKPWPPYGTTKPESIVKFLRHTIESIDTVRHVIAYESTHGQRPEILQAAADRLFELS